MSVPTPYLRKIKDVKNENQKLRDARSFLELEAAKSISKYNELKGQIEELHVTIQALRRERDNENQAVQSLKDTRERVQREARVLENDLATKATRVYVSERDCEEELENLQDQLRSLEWRHQTMPTEPREERALMLGAKTIQSKIIQLKKARILLAELNVIKQKIKALRSEADQLHRQILIRAAESQKRHVQLQENRNMITSRLREARQIYDLYKKQYDKLKQLGGRRAASSEISEYRLADEQTHPPARIDVQAPSIDDANRKARKQQKLSLLEFQALMKAGGEG